MKPFIYLILLTLPLTGFSATKTEKRKLSSGQGAHVLQMDSDFPIDAITDPEITTHSMAEIGANSEALPISVQARFFRESGLAPFLNGWSGFEQDRLALRAEHQPAAEVANRYEGKIPAQNIQNFKSLVKKFRGEKSQEKAHR